MNTTGDSRSDGMARRLEVFLAAELGRSGALVRDLLRLSGGASRETYAFDLVEPVPAEGNEELVRPLVMQRVRRGALSESFSMVGEAQLLRAAALAGVPVPEVVAASDDPQVVGSQFVVVTRLSGETIARRILRDEQFDHARSVLIEQCAAALAAIHAIDPDVVPTLQHQDVLRQTRGLYDQLDEPHPAFELAFSWLENEKGRLGSERLAGTDSADRSRVVHGDFRLGNLLVDREGLRAVLDWELAHLGDPVEDLGWFCLKAWRFGGGLPVAGLGSYDEFLSAYERCAGHPVDRHAFRWWQTMGTLRWGVICILQARTHLAGQSRSVELAAIGRRVCETEFDLLGLLSGSPEQTGPSGPTVVEGAGMDAGAGTVYDSRLVGASGAVVASSGLHGRPTAAELLEAVREFLMNDVMEVGGSESSRVRFHARVAANVLGIVERELIMGADLEKAHRERLARFGCRSDRELAEAIRNGTVESGSEDLKAAILESVIDKLRVANPSYLKSS